MSSVDTTNLRGCYLFENTFVISHLHIVSVRASICDIIIIMFFYVNTLCVLSHVLDAVKRNAYHPDIADVFRQAVSEYLKGDSKRLKG